MCHMDYFGYHFYHSPTAFESFPVCSCSLSPLGSQRCLMPLGGPGPVHPPVLHLFRTNPLVNIYNLAVKFPLQSGRQDESAAVLLRPVVRVRGRSGSVWVRCLGWCGLLVASWSSSGLGLGLISTGHKSVQMMLNLNRPCLNFYFILDTCYVRPLNNNKDVSLFIMNLDSLAWSLRLTSPVSLTFSCSCAVRAAQATL